MYNTGGVPAAKQYVGVVAYFFKDGSMKPAAIDLGDGRLYKIKRVKECVRAASLKSGGGGMRYRCVVGSNEVYLYFEDPCWFCEYYSPFPELSSGSSNVTIS